MKKSNSKIRKSVISYVHKYARVYYKRDLIYIFPKKSFIIFKTMIL